MRRFIFALATSAALTTQAAAQEPAWCKTGSGAFSQPGQVFRGIHGLITSPDGADRVEVDKDTINAELLPGGQRVALVLAAEEGTATLRFYTGSDEIHSCRVQATRFDGERHDLRALTYGQCGWISRQNTAYPSGMALYVETPARFT